MFTFRRKVILNSINIYFNLQIICCKSRENVLKIKFILLNDLKMSDLNHLNYYVLGHLCIKDSKYYISVNQHNMYLEKLLQRFSTNKS